MGGGGAGGGRGEGACSRVPSARGWVASAARTCVVEIERDIGFVAYIENQRPLARPCPLPPAHKVALLEGGLVGPGGSVVCVCARRGGARGMGGRTGGAGGVGRQPPRVGRAEWGTSTTAAPAPPLARTHHEKWSSRVGLYLSSQLAMSSSAPLAATRGSAAPLRRAPRHGPMGGLHPAVVARGAHEITATRARRAVRDAGAIFDRLAGDR